MLAAEERGHLERVLAERARATGAPMAIAIFRSLEGASLEDFSIRLAQQWRIGEKGLDNGVILVVFVRERRMRFEVGYGLEPVMTDAVASGIIRETIAPRFREGRYGAGLEAAVGAVYSRIETRAPAKGAGTARDTRVPWTLVLFGGVVLVIVLVLGMEAYRSSRFVRPRGYTARGGQWGPIIFPGPGWGGGGGRWSGWGGGGGGSGHHDSGFSGGGGAFGGGGASGEW